MLVDEGNRIAKEYGLVFELPDQLKQIYSRFGLNLPEFNGDESWTLPMPARFVIDRSGIIRWAAVHPDYTTRPEPSETIEVLNSLH